MKTTAILIAAGILASAACSTLSSCSGSKNQEIPVDSAAAPVVLTIDSVMADPAALAGDTITIEGLCTHLCSHGGRKAFLANADTSLMVRCNATEAIGRFDSICVGKDITVSGVWRAQKFGKSQLEAFAAAEAEAAGADAHCDTEKRASGSAAEWLDKLNAQIAAGGDTTIVTAYYLEADSYSVPVE